ncbi:MAG: sulfatase arylsulfatase [Planctomycetes bacterium RBG_13_63_9]|nr:MAG: sulfatase arylsulfatase [Planctomycetes bacterium RBG_13_63_9]
MTEPSKRRFNRRTLLKRSAVAAACAAGAGAGAMWLGSRKFASTNGGKKVIVIGFDGMDPGLSQHMMDAGLLPNLDRLRKGGGFRRLGTSIPPQSPVAWANFINGAGPGSHGIFDFIHRHPHDQCAPFFSAAETVGGQGYWEVGDHKLQLDFWPFNHKPPTTLLRRQGVPFWDYLDEAGIPSTFYDLPSNYPPSPSKHGNQRCISGMGTPDMLGTYGTYQHFAEDGPPEVVDEGGGKRTRLTFERETARARILGPENSFLKEPSPTSVELLVHRDREANAAVIEVQGRKIVLGAGEWSPWLRLDFELSTPAFVPDENVSGICRFYLQEVAPNFRLYVTPVNIDPSAPAVQMAEPASFVEDVSSRLGLFYTAGFQEDHKALSNGVFSDDEFVRQADMVLEERLALLDYALNDYDDGLLFFYFSSTDLQSHMLWWDSDEPHPTRSAAEATKYSEHIRRLYRKLDGVVGDLLARYGNRATFLVMSDHGFANFGRQFNLNSCLRYYGYLGPPECTSLFRDVDWSQTAAYGLGINGLYLNLKGRERDGIVEPGDQQEALLRELARGLESIRDVNGQRVIRCVHRTDKAYSGGATTLAPDLVIGYCRGYRASWATCLGDLTDEVLLDNDSAWSADHCADASEVPGVLLTNRPIDAKAPSLVDLAPSILNEFGLPIPSSMEGRNIFSG